MTGIHLHRLARLLAGFLTTFVLLLGFHAAAYGARAAWKTEFDHAEFVLSDEAFPPGDRAGWKPVSLPDEWRRTNPGLAGQGWYRITFDLAQAPATLHAIYRPYLRSYEIDYFVNGALVGGSRHVPAMNTAGTVLGQTVFITVAPHLLHTGTNVIHVRMRATSAAASMHGLGRMTFGDAREVRKGYIGRIEQEAEALRSFFAMAFATGLIMLCLWLARPRDRVMLLLAVACLSWAFVAGWQRPLRWVELPPVLRDILRIYLSYGLPSWAFILSLRTARLDLPQLEKAAYAYLFVLVTLPVWGTGGGDEWRLAVDVVNTGLLLAGVAVIALHARRPMRWSAILQIAALALMALLISSEFMRYLAWVSPDAALVRHFHVPVMIVGIGAAVLVDHVLAVWRAQNINVELERRIAETAREIEANRARVEEARREQALARERQRIIADMHDGLGASLVGLLRFVQAERADPYIEQRVKEALQELRIAIDALEPSDGDLGTVLGNLRYRLEPLLESSGTGLDWEVAELPRIEALEPTAVFAFQRIVLEAVANAVKHSGATRVRLWARTAGNAGVEIRIEDDGRGFDSAHPPAGLGLANMRARTARIGAQIDISSRPGDGTVVRLLIPPVLATMPKDRASGKPEPRGVYELFPAPGTA